MAFRYLIYSTGTTYSRTIVRESAINNPGAFEASFFTDFMIQPLYLWQVDNAITPTNVIPNTDSNINNYEQATAPAPTSNDLVTYGQLTGATATKIDKVSGQTGKVPVFTSGGGLQSSTYSIAQLTGLTTYTFQGSGGTTVTQTGNNIKITSTVPTGATVSWGGIVGTISNQTDLWHILTGTTAATASKLSISTFNFYTGTTAPATYLTKSAFNIYSGTTVPANYYNKSQINSYSASTLTNINSRLLTSVFNTFTGTTLPAGYYNKAQINSYTGQTSTLIGTKISKVTGATVNDIATFSAGGSIQDSGKQFTTTVQSVGLATNNNVPTELAVRNAINSAIVAAVILQGDWNATTNTPDLQVTGITTGYAWRVSVSGTTNLGGITYWQVGDMAIKSASGWIRTVAADISAIWGNIVGTLSNQTDLQNALNAKLNTSTFSTYTGTTVPNTYYNKSQINSYSASTLTNINSRLLTSVFNIYTGTTAPATYLTKSAFNSFTGTTLPAGYYNKSQINSYSASTLTNINSRLLTSVFSTFTGTTLPANYYNKSQINSYSAQTQTQINSKLNTSVFTGYTASTKNKDKKIQVVSTSVINVNVVTPTGVTWSSVPVSADTYLWTASSATTVYIKSAGTYEVQYHVLLKNDTANQTHSIGGYIVKNASSTLPNTATATMIVGPSASGELSLPPVVQTFANNDKLVLTLFRIGSAGTVNLTANSVTFTLNKLT
jgi:hypothetical protein